MQGQRDPRHEHGNPSACQRLLKGTLKGSIGFLKGIYKVPFTISYMGSVGFRVPRDSNIPLKGSIRVPERFPTRDLQGLGFRRLQYPLLIKEYTFTML